VRKRSIVFGLSLLLSGAVFSAAKDHQKGEGENGVRHVLLISVDGLHALDVAKYTATHPHSALAELASHGVTYSGANTPQNSDSFPGLLALVTGGSPVTSGLFYDVSYDRKIFDPKNTTCTEPAGNLMVFDESIDKYDSHSVSLNVIDPAKLPRHRDANGNCVPLWPHQALRTNTIFEVVRESGGHTAWEDKHPAYDIVNGPSGLGVEDLYTPEVTNVNGLDNTHSVVCTAQNDQLKVQGIINEIQGLKHDGTPGPGVPTVFGMNFQAVSVGQKLSADNFDGSCVTDTGSLVGKPGGYIDGSGAPTAVLSYALDYADGALASIIKALKDQGIYDSTLFIVTAKHGQTPINPLKTNKPGHLADVVASLPDGTTNPAAIAITSANACTTSNCGSVNDDDIALIWLAEADQSKGRQVRDYLNKNAIPLFIDEVMGGEELTLRFGDPLKDTRTPDIIVRPTYGTIYTASTAKNAEHGGYNYSDTNVGLIVSIPGLEAQTIKSPITSAQVAPTILRALGLDPQALKSVRVEKTRPLPGLGSGESE
jgi:predicted AlkP superfamily pyrophosphatase or phosphodiesterase